MSFGNNPVKPQMKSFVTETELEEKRKVRQAEWEKVRKADQPLECPDAPADNRTLYDRLREQKVKEEEEKEEAKKMKNFVRGLEHDEVEFLDYVDDIYTKMEREKMEQERAVLREFKETVAASTVISVPVTSHLARETPKRKEAPGMESASKKKSHKELLASVVRVKRSNSECDSSSTSGTATGVPLANLSEPNKPSLLVAEYGSDSD